METDGSLALSPAAGWYSDPADAANARWWDGARWTEEVRPVAPAIVQPVAVPRAAEPVYVPFQHERAVAATAQPRGISYTGAGWWISFQPLWSIAPQGVLLAALSLLGAGSAPLLALVSAGVIVVSGLLALVFAIVDSRALMRGGNAAAASWLWMLLSPLAYLIVRGREIRNWDDSPWGALIWWIVATVVAPAFFFLAYFIVLGIVP